MGGSTSTGKIGAPSSGRPAGSNTSSGNSGSTRGNYGRPGSPANAGSSKSGGTSGGFGKAPGSTPARTDRPGERGRSVDARNGNSSRNEVHTKAGEAHVPRAGTGNGHPERTRYTPPPRHISEEHGHRVARDEHNRVREIHTRDSRGANLAIHRDYRGGIHYETRRPDGHRVVGYGNGRGFYERRYYAPRGGRVYYQRTYIYGGRRYAVAYRYYPYRGVYYYRYAPVVYYHPVFYGWAYRPWGVPVIYRWGWYSDPWFGYYGYYFNPYPSYLNASLWLTDFLLAESLRASYDARANAAVAEANANAAAAQANAEAAQANADAAAQYAAQSQGGQVTLTPEVKQMIANEVERQLQAQQAAAAQPQAAAAPSGGGSVAAEEVPDALDPNQRIFIVADNLDLAGEQGECTVTAGDVLMRMGTTPDENNKIGVTVVSSKKGDCPANTNSDVAVSELQEMHNHFREKLDNGLKALAENQGKNGLPKAPDVSTVAGEAPAPTPDSNAGTELEHQEKDADKTEKQVQNGAPGGK
jgi:hypothetical protein